MASISRDQGCNPRGNYNKSNNKLNLKPLFGGYLGRGPPPTRAK